MNLQRRSITCTLAALIAYAYVPGFAQSQSTKVSTFKLANYGWQPLPKIQPAQLGEWPGSSSRLVSIDHESRVLVGFTARQDNGLATREHPGLAFSILRFTHEGKLDLSLVLPTKDYFANGFYLGAKDQILARADDQFQVLSKDEDETRKRETWQPLLPCPKYCYISQSFTRRTLILRVSEKPLDSNNSTYTIIDASSSSPRVVQTCSQMALYAEQITDNFAYWNGSDGYEGFTRRFPFCDVNHAEELAYIGGGAFSPLSDNAFLLLSDVKYSRGVVKLVGPDGKVRFQREMPKNEVPQYWLGSATSDERGDRFAFTVGNWRGGSRFLDISGKLVARRVVVYDEAGQEVASVSVSTAYHRDFDFSLSPDGHRLAIVDEGVLTVVDLK